MAVDNNVRMNRRWLALKNLGFVQKFLVS